MGLALVHFQKYCLLSARPWAAAGNGTATGRGVARGRGRGSKHGALQPWAVAGVAGVAALSAVAGRGRWWRAAADKSAGLIARGTAFMDSHDSRRFCLASLLSL